MQNPFSIRSLVLAIFSSSAFLNISSALSGSPPSRPSTAAASIPFIPLELGTLTLFTFGIGTIFAHFGVFIEDLSNIVNILLRLLFYLSGIFYSVTKRIPAPYGKILGTANPIAFFIDQSRGALLYGANCDWIFLGVWFVVSVILCIIGIKTIYKYENSYVKVI